MKSALWQKIYGCLLGGLIGDAMGAPAEGLHFQEIAERFGTIQSFQGAGTDDSAIKLILCQAIIEHDGDVTADEFARSFLNNKQEYYPLFYIPVKNMLHKIESGLSLPVYAGHGNMHSSSSAMSIAPMGLINACQPRLAAQESFDVAGLIHAGEATFCRDGACALAAAIAEAMKPAARVSTVLAAATAYLHPDSSREMTGAIDDCLALARACEDYSAFREAFYSSWLRDIISDSRETVPCVLALFYLADGDPVQAITYAANFGRDADTIGTMAGALAGAFSGVRALKEEWVSQIESGYGKTKKVSRDYGMEGITLYNQYQLADQLTELTRRKAGRRQQDLNLLNQLNDV